MQIVDRIVVFLFTVIIIVLSLATMGLALNLFNLDYLFSFINNLEGNLQAGIVALLFFLVSVRILYYLIFFKREKVSQTVIAENELGFVKITLDSINRLVKDIVLQEEGIVNIKSKVNERENGVDVFLDLGVISGENISELTKKLQTSVKKEVTESTGAEINKVEILIDEIKKLQDEDKKTTQLN